MTTVAASRDVGSSFSDAIKRSPPPVPAALLRRLDAKDAPGVGKVTHPPTLKEKFYYLFVFTKYDNYTYNFSACLYLVEKYYRDLYKKMKILIIKSEMEEVNFIQM